MITEGAINTAYRKTPAWPLIVICVPTRSSSAPHDSGMYVRWYADLLWIFGPIQGEVGTPPQLPRTIRRWPADR